MATKKQIQDQLVRLGACSDDQAIGLDCDFVRRGVASFSDSQETASYPADAALAALAAASVSDGESGFEAAWQALAKIEVVS